MRIIMSIDASFYLMTKHGKKQLLICNKTT